MWGGEIFFPKMLKLGSSNIILLHLCDLVTQTLMADYLRYSAFPQKVFAKLLLVET